jgi:hypothetical protein
MVRSPLRTQKTPTNRNALQQPVEAIIQKVMPTLPLTVTEADVASGEPHRLYLDYSTNRPGYQTQAGLDLW